jgi:hypothetical protein
MINLENLEPLAAAAVASERAASMNAPGVYAVFFNQSTQLVERSGYLQFDRQRPFSKDGYDLLYVGASLDPVSRRVMEHLVGNTKGSSLRMTVGALMTIDLGIDPVGVKGRNYFDFGFDGEERLTDWFLANTRVASVASREPFREEQDLITTTALPFNINERRRHPFSKYLMSLRAVIAGRPAKASAAVSLATVLPLSGPCMAERS